MEQERLYLEKVITFLKARLIENESDLKGKFAQTIKERRIMWENAPNSPFDGHDIDSMMDNVAIMLSYLTEVDVKTSRYIDTLAERKRNLRMLELPYFARIDFTEEGFDAEQIYIGLSNLMNDGTMRIYVYDWRSPIAGVYYNYELGSARYLSPDGEVVGDVTLKRQYKIKNGELVYYIDSSVSIGDEMLREALSRNSTAQMRSIVETIQKEQNQIIRNMENDLLIVQGVAGSGKTSIALHRVAYLLYNGGTGRKLTPDNMIIISPNRLFNRYISQVLPELGEENVNQTTFDDMASALLGRSDIQTRAEYLEDIISGKNETDADILAFKCSGDYKRILDALIVYYMKHEMCFQDVYYDGIKIADKNLLKTEILNDKLKIPVAKKLSRLEMKIQSRIEDMKKSRYKKIFYVVNRSQKRAFEEKAFSEVMMNRDLDCFYNRLHEILSIDAAKVYRLLYEKPGLLKKLADKLDIKLCSNISPAYGTPESLAGRIKYEDMAGMLYLKLSLEGPKPWRMGGPEDKGQLRPDNIKHVVIDEAQDYYPLHYAVFNILFGGAKYTVLGDYNQTLEKQADISVYNAGETFIGHKKALLLPLYKSYRSSVEISAFANRLLGDTSGFISFERSEEAPETHTFDNEDEAAGYTIDVVRSFQNEQFNTIAIICKTVYEADNTAKRLKKAGIAVSELDEYDGGVTVIPSYMAKGLEFDAVVVYNASEENYYTEMDRRLLYAACTRALHRLVLCAAGELSGFIKN